MTHSGNSLSTTKDNNNNNNDVETSDTPYDKSDTDNLQNETAPSELSEADIETHQLAEDVVEICVKSNDNDCPPASEAHSESNPETDANTNTDTSVNQPSDEQAHSNQTTAAPLPLTPSSTQKESIEDDSDSEAKKQAEALKDSETLKAEKEAQLEAYRQFIAEQENHKEIDYQKIRISIEANALPSSMYFIMNALSAIIASYGLVVNSAAVVIGAMLVAMMLGPISGVALAIIDYRIPFLKKSLLTVFAGGIMVITIGFIIGLLHQGQPLTNEILSRTQPTSMDLMIALAGGTAGAYAIISPHLSVAVVGVAVATALVPPLAASGILFANGEGSLGFGALLLALTNIIAIQFTNALVLWFSGFRRLVKDDYKKGTAFIFFRRNAVTLLLLLGLGIYLSVNLNVIARTQRFENDVKSMISDYFIDQGDVLTATQFVNRDEYQTIRAVIRGETQPTATDVEILEQKITERIEKNYPNIRPVHLQIRYLPVIVIEADPEQTDKIDQTDAAILSSEK